MIGKRICRSVGVAGFIVLCWLFIGVLQIDGENSVSNRLFIKQSPTFHFIFRDPYQSTPRDEEHIYAKRRDQDGNWLPNTEEFYEYQQYCRYRYGISGAIQAQADKKCKELDAAQ